MSAATAPNAGLERVGPGLSVRARTAEPPVRCLMCGANLSDLAEGRVRRDARRDAGLHLAVHPEPTVNWGTRSVPNWQDLDSTVNC